MAANPVAVANAPSTWDTIKNGAINGTDWICRKVQWLGGTIKDGVVTLVNQYVKPFFQVIVKFLAERYEQIKELVANNKEMTLYSIALVSIAAVVTLTAAYVCNYFGEGSSSKA